MAGLGAALVLLGVPNLSTGADPCVPGSRLAATARCLDGSAGAGAPARLRSFEPAAAPRQAAADPATTPPLHGTEPHGQGTVAVIDTNPDPTRPYTDSTTGNGEDIVVGRSRGGQRADGTYYGHITVASLFGNEIVGVDTRPGETKSGPLSAVQTNLLDALCNGSGNQICLSAVTVDSTTTNSGSTNRFSVAHAKLGGDNGIEVGAAESNGNISSDGNCQTSRGDSQAADVRAGGQAVASLSKSSTESKACRGQAPQQTNTSSVLSLGGSGVPLPDPGCADGTPDTVTGIPTLLPIVCNADDTNGSQAGAPYGVREALDAFVLATGTAAAAKLTTAASESRAVAPSAGGGGGPEQCADGIDNDGDGLIDAADPQCHTDGNPNNPNSYNPGGKSEAGGAQCADGKDNDGDGLIDAADPGCHTDGNANNPNSYNPADNDESNGTGTGGGGLGGGKGNGNGQGNGGGGESACSDGVDNDGDGLIDAADPGCHSDGNANNPASYVPSDDSELNGGVAGVTASQALSRGTLPFTGSDVVGLALIAALMIGGGLALRRVRHADR